MFPEAPSLSFSVHHQESKRMPCDYAQTGDKWKLLGDPRKPERDEAVLQLSQSLSGADAGDVMWFGVTKECSDDCEPQPLTESDCAIVYTRLPYRIKAEVTFGGEEYSLHKVRHCCPWTD